MHPCLPGKTGKDDDIASWTDLFWEDRQLRRGKRSSKTKSKWSSSKKSKSSSGNEGQEDGCLYPIVVPPICLTPRTFTAPNICNAGGWTFIGNNDPPPRRCIISTDDDCYFTLDDSSDPFCLIGAFDVGIGKRKCAATPNYPEVMYCPNVQCTWLVNSECTAPIICYSGRASSDKTYADETTADGLFQAFNEVYVGGEPGCDANPIEGKYVLGFESDDFAGSGDTGYVLCLTEE